MSEIYGPQANITFFSPNPNRIVDNNGVQGLVDVDQSIANDERRTIFATKNADKGTRFRVFFVGQISSSEKALAVTDKPGPNCLCQDSLLQNDGIEVTTDPDRVALILAHEAGHAFGEEDSKDPALLMFEAARNGKRIPPDAAERMSKELRQKR